MTEKLKITLAGKPYEVASPLAFGTIIDLRVAAARPEAADPQEETRRSYLRSLEIISIGLRKLHPDMTPDAMRDLPMTEKEVGAAVAAVLKFSGLELKDPGEGEKPGEEKAGAA